MRLRVLVVVVVLALCGAVEAYAERGAGESPRKLLRKGNDLFAAGDYQAAFEAFRAAHQQKPTPVFLRSMAFCRLKMYRHKEARKLLAEYLSRYPKAPDKGRIGKTLEDLDVVVATKIEITSTPAGADVFIDVEAAGKRGTTPYRGTIEPGEHTVILSLDGYQTATKTLTIKPKQTATLALALAIPIEIESSPPGATVHVDSADAGAIGKTPLRTTLSPGAHTVYLKREGYKTYRAPVTAAAGKSLLIEAELLVGVMVQSIPPGASIMVDGQPYEGATPTEIAAAPGPHLVELTLPGFKKDSRNVELTVGNNPTITSKLRGGLLSMRTDVPGARVRVGQFEIGRTPLAAAPVPMGPQRVWLEHPSRRGWSSSLAFSDTDLVSAQIALGHKSWPFWSMAAISAGAFIASIATFVAAVGKTNDLNDREVYDNAGTAADPLVGARLGTGVCTNDPAAARYPYQGGEERGVDSKDTFLDKDGAFISSSFSADDCSHGLHHSTTTLMTIGSAGAIGALVYYLFFMRPEAEITRKPRGEAISAAAARRQL